MTADGPGMTCLNGLVGHHGRVHCRLYCPLNGRRKPGGTTYYPTRLKPDNYSIAGCDHPDVQLQDLLSEFTPESSTIRYEDNLHRLANSRSKTQYEKQRLETGICKPSIFSGLPPKHILGLPGCFAGDAMHLPALNIPDLLIPLWRGLFDCDKNDDKDSWDWAVLKNAEDWKEHGKQVACATPYIPGSFDRPPRNPADKINSGYKAWEFMLYIYGLGPCLFYKLLPEKYWKNYCKLVRGIQIILQEEVSSEELLEAHGLLLEFSDEFEKIYVQRRTDRIHFVRPSIHAIGHLALEIFRIGPSIIYSQWAMERTIGNLGEEIKQHSNPFSNLAQRGLRRCQVNAIKAMVPDIEPPEENKLPRNARDLGDGYILLTATDKAARKITLGEANALRAYLVAAGQAPGDNWNPLLIRWGRVRLPNGQIARSSWKESEKSKVRTSRNVMVSILFMTQAMVLTSLLLYRSF